MNEAVELAKKYGEEDSGRFVNGILGAVVKELKHTGALKKGPLLWAERNPVAEGRRDGLLKVGSGVQEKIVIVDGHSLAFRAFVCFYPLIPPAGGTNHLYLR